MDFCISALERAIAVHGIGPIIALLDGFSIASTLRVEHSPHGMFAKEFFKKYGPPPPCPPPTLPTLSADDWTSFEGLPDSCNLLQPNSLQYGNTINARHSLIVDPVYEFDPWQGKSFERLPSNDFYARRMPALCPWFLQKKVNGCTQRDHLKTTPESPRRQVAQREGDEMENSCYIGSKQNACYVCAPSGLPLTHTDVAIADHSTSDLRCTSVSSNRGSRNDYATLNKQKQHLSGQRRTPCKFFSIGACKHGARCRFSHEGIEYNCLELASRIDSAGGDSPMKKLNDKIDAPPDDHRVVQTSAK